MSLALLFHYLLLNMFRMLVHPSSGACDLLWFYGFYYSGSMWVVRLGWCGIFMQAEAVFIQVKGHSEQKRVMDHLAK